MEILNDYRNNSVQIIKCLGTTKVETDGCVGKGSEVEPVPPIYVSLTVTVSDNVYSLISLSDDKLIELDYMNDPREEKKYSDQAQQ